MINENYLLAYRMDCKLTKKIVIKNNISLSEWVIFAQKYSNRNLFIRYKIMFVIKS